MKSNKRFFYNARLKLAKNQAEAGNTLRCCYLKTIRFPHPLYHPSIVEYIFKNVQKQVRLFKQGYMTMKMELKMKNGSHR